MPFGSALLLSGSHDECLPTIWAFTPWCQLSRAPWFAQSHTLPWMNYISHYKVINVTPINFNRPQFSLYRYMRDSIMEHRCTTHSTLLPGSFPRVVTICTGHLAMAATLLFLENQSPKLSLAFINWKLKRKGTTMAKKFKLHSTIHASYQSSLNDLSVCTYYVMSRLSWNSFEDGMFPLFRSHCSYCWWTCAI